MGRSKIVGRNIELFLRCRIINSLPIDIMEILNFLFKRKDTKEKIKKIPKHPFFQCKYWEFLGNNYLPGIKINYFDGINLISLCRFDNYDQEIDLFLDWLNPYIDAKRGAVIGWKWCEGYNFPKLIFKRRLKKQYKYRKFNVRCSNCITSFEETLKRRERRKKIDGLPICEECTYREKNKIRFKNLKVSSLEEKHESFHVLSIAHLMRKFKITSQAAKQWIDHYHTINNLLKN